MPALHYAIEGAHYLERDKSRIYLPGGGLPSEELVVKRTVGGVKLGLQEDAAIGYGLKRGRTFIWEAKSNEQLDRKMKGRRRK